MIKAKIKVSLSKEQFLEKFIEDRVEELRKYKIKANVDKDTITFRYKGRGVVFERGDAEQVSNTFFSIAETFGEKQYRYLDVSNKIVVDIGANRGDSAIYFSLNGAKHVYSFEPFPYSYNLAKRNIELNGLENRITLLNKGCGKDGFVNIEEDYRNKLYSEMRDFGKGKKVEVMSLRKINKSYHIPPDSRLKLDCESCEYPIIMDSDFLTLATFKQIFMEYHYGHRKLMNKLKKNLFHVQHLHSYNFYNQYAKKCNMVIGIMLAEFTPKYEDLIKYLKSGKI